LLNITSFKIVFLFPEDDMKYWYENALINEKSYFMEKQKYPESCNGILVA